MPQNQEDKRAELKRAALEYHEFPTPGKLAIAATKQLTNQRDLALAYSPGVAAACEEIVADPANAFRYTSRGNDIANRRDILTGSTNGLDLLVNLRDTISSAMYRLHPDMEDTDLYPIRIDRKSLRAGSVLYDPNGHLAVVYKIEDDGRILYMDSHPDNSLTRGTYGRKFVRSSPGMGSGFKNWRPVRLEGEPAMGAVSLALDLLP